MTPGQIETLRKMAAKARQDAACWREIADTYESHKLTRIAADYQSKASLAEKQAAAVEAAIARLDSEVQG